MAPTFRDLAFWIGNIVLLLLILVVVTCIFSARWIAIRPFRGFPHPRSYRGERIASDLQICPECRHVLYQSALLAGSWAVFTRSVEWHEFHSRDYTCRLCTVLFSTMQKQQLNRTTSETRLSASLENNYGTVESSESQTLKLKIFQLGAVGGITNIQLHGNGYSSKVFRVYESARTRPQPVSSERVDIVSQDLQAGKRSYDTGSDAIISTAKTWIASCSSSHPTYRCREDLTVSKQMALTWPKRLVYILATGTLIRVIEVDNTSREGLQYIALSHCWGTGIPLKLTSGTYGELTTSVKVSDLPRNFQDAIDFSFRLGYSYVWIDSLCILQDSKRDWITESAKMGDIFMNAVCTISATASKDTHGGCYQERDSFLYTRSVLMASNRIELYIDPKPRERFLSLDQLFMEKVDSAPLSQRAWTFQERLLSR